MELQRDLDVYSAFEELQACAVVVAGNTAGWEESHSLRVLTCKPTWRRPTPMLCSRSPQGAGGLYYTGELLNGLGVPLQAYGAAALVSAHFS